MLDHFTGRSRGFGFVTFDNEEAVDKIFVDGQLHELGEAKEVEIKMAKLKRLLSISHTTTVHVVVVLSSHKLVDLVAVGVMAENQRGYYDYGFISIMWEVMVVVLQ